MRRRPITFDEKIDARFTRGPQSQCWFWQGSVRSDGWPAINLRQVTRYIYEREIAPIPPGMILARTDHRRECRPNMVCIHRRCVNPYHVRLTPSRKGLYEREVEHDITSPDIASARKRRVRMKERENRDGRHQDREDLASPGDEEGD